MEQKNSDTSDDPDGDLTTNQIKLKAQEIVKRYEKYQGRNYTSSSRCNTPLPITSADSIESLHSAVSDTSLLFRQYLENDRKLLENSELNEINDKTDKLDNEDDEILEAQMQKKKEKSDATYYDDIITAQMKEKNMQSLKNQVAELSEKVENYCNVLNEKDVIIKSKVDKIESLNKVILQKNKLHLETVEELKKRNIETINEERLRCTHKINKIVEETADLQNNLEYTKRICNELKKNNIEIDKENTELRKVEHNLKSDIEKLNSIFENEKMLLLKESQESSKKVIDDMEKKMQHLHQENDSLLKRLTSLENKSIDIEEKENFLAQLNLKEAEIHRLNIENEKLNREYQNQTLEAEQTKNRWVQLKDAYLNDKDRMTFLEKVIEELKINNDELNNTNVNLTEKIETYFENLAVLKAENSSQKDKISDLMAVIENIQANFEKAINEASIENENDKKRLIQQHENDELLLKNCNKKLEVNTSKLNEVTHQLEKVLKDNESYKCERVELKNCLGRSDSHILELNNVISELHKQMSVMTNELEFLKKENLILSDKINGTSFETDEYKQLSDRFQKQKQLLRLKIKALKESENNCLNLQQQVVSLTNESNALNQKSEFLSQCNKKIIAVLQHCDSELHECYELLSNIVLKSTLQSKSIFVLRFILMSLSSLFCFDDYSAEISMDVDLLKIADSISCAISDDNELQICLKKIILDSAHVFEYIIYLHNSHKRSKAELIAHTEVEKLISEAIEKVKLSTQNEYNKQNDELLSLIENLQNDNDTLKLQIFSRTLENKEVLTDLNGPTIKSILSLENLDVKNIKHENDMLKQFLKSMHLNFGLTDIKETDDVQLTNDLSNLELLVQRMINENTLLKDQYLEQQKLIASKTFELQNNKLSDSSTQNPFNESIENPKENCWVDDINMTVSLTSENDCIQQHNSTEKSTSEISGDYKNLLLRYKNLKSRFKEVRAKTVDLDKKIVSLTNDLECANSKYIQLNDRYINDYETHETDIVNCQSEIENLMCEKLEAYRQLTALKEKHEILQNDYDQLKSNLDERSTSETFSVNSNEQNTILKGQLNHIQSLIDSAYSRVFCEWPTIDTNFDWVAVQSKKLDQIVEAKCVLPISGEKDFNAINLEEKEAEQLKTCIQTIQNLVNSIVTDKCTNKESATDELIGLMTDLKSCIETFLELTSPKEIKLDLVDEHHDQLCNNDEDSNTYLPENPLSSDKSLIINSSILPKETVKPSSSGLEENEHFQRAISERDRLIEFLSEKISKLDNFSRSVDDIKLIKDKLDRALTAVHERDVRCAELTLELTRLLEERDMLQLKLSSSIRQIQVLSESKSQEKIEEKYSSKTIDDKLEELHSLEYRRDADLFADQEQRHMSQMQLHQSQQNSSETKSRKITEETNSSQSWFKDILW